MSITDAELNQNIKLAPHDKFLQYALLWIFPRRWIKPNHITAARFLTSPIVFFLLWKGFYFSGLIVFVLVAFTDAIDGTMARTRRQITLWGTQYDGVADKFLIIGVVLILVIHRIGWLFASSIVAVELTTVIVAAHYGRKGIVHAANWWGKSKMIIQVLATVLMLSDVVWNITILTQVGLWLFVLSILFAFASMLVHGRQLYK